MILILLLGIALGAAGHFVFYDLFKRFNCPDLYHYVCGVLIAFIPFYLLIWREYGPLLAYAFAFGAVGVGVVCARLLRRVRGTL